MGYRSGHQGSWRSVVKRSRAACWAALLLGLVGCFEPATLAVPGHERVLHGGFVGTLRDWPNDEGVLRFALAVEAAWESEDRYRFTGVMTLEDGAEHAVSGSAHSLGRVRFEPAASGSPAAAAAPPPVYALYAHVPSLSLGICAEEVLARTGWRGVAMVVQRMPERQIHCSEQFFFSLERVPGGA